VLGLAPVRSLVETLARASTRASTGATDRREQDAGGDAFPGPTGGNDELEQ
jgi:hypothetical protein